MNSREKIRAVSWWLTWKDLQWPDDDVADAIERRADAAAEAGVNCAVIFGAHFRWDYLPLWDNLHDLLGTIRGALHRRGIRLFDHHSAVLTHRYSGIEEARAMRTFNKHHIPFAPSREVASTWTFHGEHLNDWRMIDITTGKPVFLKAYTAEEFCINNPGFRRAYCEYVKMLVSASGIDGLMCDDGLFYSGWTSCGCQWCRKKFREEYGHELPPVEDLTFWGNYSSEAFKDWIEMRFASTREFLEAVRSVLGDGYPLMACCSSSANYEMAKFALTYQEFCKPCNYIMLEMTGNTPELDGCWNRHFPEQALHLGLAAEYGYPCLGLGYGYTETTADFIWAFNQFLGSSTWFSTLKGRLGLPDSVTSLLKDDPELVGHAYNWEKDHTELLDGETDTETAVFFSRWTRDYYGMTQEDYGRDYDRCCIDLLDHNITFDVVSRIPEKGKYRVLVICSAICLDDSEYAALSRFLADGGCVIAGGPVGCRDKRALPRPEPWLSRYGITCDVKEPERPASFPPSAGMRPEMPVCTGSFRGNRVSHKEWIRTEDGSGSLLWTPGRMQSDSQEMNLPAVIRRMTVSAIDFPGTSCRGWRFRRFRGRNGQLILHALASAFEVETMKELERQRKNPRGNHLISGIRRKDSSSEITLKINVPCRSAKLYAPMAGFEKEIAIGKDGEVHLHLPEHVFYFILEFPSCES